MRRSVVVCIVAAAVVVLIIAFRMKGPQPRGLDAPAREFSAIRALAVLSDLLREGVFHPVGSPANVRVRDRIVARLNGLGYSTQIQRAFVCNASFACATVENIIGRPPNAPPPYVLLAAHYDSVGAGPGATDDGVGVATLIETARAVGEENFRHPIAFLITDGEEAGLLGAEAFVADSALARQAAVIVNVENRGTSGPSLLFETSRGNRKLIDAAGRALKRGFASSIFYTIYDLLPNDTDVTVFKRAGLQTLNFAAIGDVENYHTPRDDLRHVDRNTLQHHGENALAMARELAQSDLTPASDNAVYFDIVGFALVRWPESWTLAMAVASLVLLLLSLRGSKWKDVLKGFTAFVVAILIAAVAGYVLSLISQLRSGETRFVAYPHAAIVAMWLVGLGSSLAAGDSFARRSERRSMFIGCGMAWQALAIALAFMLPGVSYLFLVPAIAFSVCSVARLKDTARILITTIAASLVFFPIASQLYTALGKVGLVPIALLVAIALTPLVTVVDRAAAMIAYVAALLASLIAVGLPSFTADHPRRDPITIDVASAVGLMGVRNGQRVVVSVRSNRAANYLIIEFEEGAKVVTINGVVPAPLNPRRSQPLRRIVVQGPEAVVELHAPAPIGITASDVSYGVPAAEAEDVAARNASNAVSSDRGDVTVSKRSGTY